jgi:amino-acid N-acetyltransferase
MEKTRLKKKPPRGKIRKAAVVDVPAIHKLIMFYANRRQMLPKSLSKLYEQVREFFVYETTEGVVGCAALHVVWEDLAEVRSVAVNSDLNGLGIGARLVDACRKEAGELRISRLFCLTFVPDFFRKMGFREVDKAELPHKIWADCVNCPQFPDCGEVPLMLQLNDSGEKK